MKLQPVFLAFIFCSIVLGSTAQAASPEAELAALRAQVKLLTEKVEALSALVHNAPQEGKSPLVRNLQLSASDSILLSTGGASISMRKDGSISILGENVSVKSRGETAIKGTQILRN